VKVVVLGGAGDMGSETVRDLIQYTDVSKVTIADRNREAAEKLAQSLGDERIAVETVDAACHDDLVRVLSGHDVAAGALGPFYRFERLIAEAVLDAGINYVSICDDHDAAEAVLKLDPVAREKGVKILTGLGWTPGLSNILARQGYEELDQADSIRIYWAGSAGDSEGLAVILHLIHIFTGKVTTFQNGVHMEIKAGSDMESVEFPAPLGKVHTYHLGHPEPVTLPRYLKGLREVTLKGGLAENYLNVISRLAASLRLTDSDKKKMLLGKAVKKTLPLLPVDKARSYSGILVEITGTRAGENVTIAYSAADRMRRLTGIPLSIGAHFMARGAIERTGVFGPEADGSVNPALFLQELERRGVKIEKKEQAL
jgi:saccharopine dehydrogenase-like NADP-dependent oxidoreductase